MPSKVYPRELYFKDDEFPLAVVRYRDPHPPVGLHSHDFSELVIILRGNSVHQIDNEEYDIGTGDAFVLVPGVEHAYSKPRDLALVNIVFDADLLRFPSWDIRKVAGFHALFTLEPRYRQQHQFRSRLHLSKDDLEIVRQWVIRMEEELEEKRPGYEFVCTGWFMQIVAHLSRCYSSMEKPVSKRLVQIGEAISYLENHYRQPLQLEELARRTHMSPSTLIRAFRDTLGTTPIQYLIHQRILRAQELLRTTPLAITEVAFQTGFTDSNYFARKFRETVGQTPSQYRGIGLP